MFHLIRETSTENQAWDPQSFSQQQQRLLDYIRRMHHDEDPFFLKSDGSRYIVSSMCYLLESKYRECMQWPWQDWRWISLHELYMVNSSNEHAVIPLRAIWFHRNSVELFKSNHKIFLGPNVFFAMNTKWMRTAYSWTSGTQVFWVTTCRGTTLFMISTQQEDMRLPNMWARCSIALHMCVSLFEHLYILMFPRCLGWNLSGLALPWTPQASLAIISEAEANSHAVSVGGVRIYDSLCLGRTFARMMELMLTLPVNKALFRSH